uniref:Ephrin RBD domain-containing protein n=1 Tax=Angiostrongylus cantonensis TaxID=6313 RepID=A0A0K0DJK8_ANGCA
MSCRCPDSPRDFVGRLTFMDSAYKIQSTEAMYVNASTSSASSTEEFKVKVPKSRKENRLLKSGFVDDNNDHLCYLDLSIVWPAAVCSVLSMFLFIGQYFY